MKKLTKKGTIGKVVMPHFTATKRPERDDMTTPGDELGVYFKKNIMARR